MTKIASGRNILKGENQKEVWIQAETLYVHKSSDPMKYRYIHLHKVINAECT